MKIRNIIFILLYVLYRNEINNLWGSLERKTYYATVGVCQPYFAPNITEEGSKISVFKNGL